MTTGPLFEHHGDAWMPTELTTGPWFGDAQHGGPPAALLARTVEGDPTPDPLHTVRLTVELLKPVPLAPLHIERVIIRPGRRTRIIQASLLADGTEVARATALQLRAEDHAVPDPPAPTEPPAPPEAGIPLTRVRRHEAAFHRDAVELRFTKGSFTTPGDGFAWIRLRGPVVAGETPSPLQRVAAAADFGNAVGAYLHPREWYYVNPDLTIYLDRPPAGEWIGLESTTRAHRTGIGLAESALYDTAGRVGRSLQSLLVWPRDG